MTLPLPEGLLVFCEAAQYHMLWFALLRQRSVHDPLALSLVQAHIVTKERFTQLCLRVRSVSNTLNIIFYNSASRNLKKSTSGSSAARLDTEMYSLQ